MSSVAEPSCSVSDQNPEAHKLICGAWVGGLTGTILISGLSLRMTMYTYAVKTNITLPQYTFMNDTILNSAKKTAFRKNEILLPSVYFLCCVYWENILLVFVQLRV